LVDDFDAEGFEGDELAGVVGEEADAVETEIGEDLGADADFVLELALPFGSGVVEELATMGDEAPVLDGDAESGFVEVDEDAGAFAGDAAEGFANHDAALALGGGEGIAIEAAGVHADEDFLLMGNLAEDEGEVALGIDGGAVGDGAEVAELAFEDTFAEALDDALVLHAVADEAGDGDHLEVVGGAEELEFRQARHGAVVVHDFADDAAGLESGKTGEIDGSFGLPGADKDAAFAGAEGEDVTGAGEILGAGVGADGNLNGEGAIGGADAGGDAVAGIDGFAEGGAELGSILGGHEGEL
jgi:hypothetical protein